MSLVCVGRRSGRARCGRPHLRGRARGGARSPAEARRPRRGQVARSRSARLSGSGTDPVGAAGAHLRGHAGLLRRRRLVPRSSASTAGRPRDDHSCDGGCLGRTSWTTTAPAPITPRAPIVTIGSIRAARADKYGAMDRDVARHATWGVRVAIIGRSRRGRTDTCRIYETLRRRRILAAIVDVAHTIVPTPSSTAASCR